MKTKTKKVYYCDFCKKHSLRSLAKHEKYCTGNADRECRLCDRRKDTTPKLKVLIRYFKRQMYIPPKTESGSIPADQIKQPKLEDIMDKVDYCPACALAIIRGCKLQHYPFSLNFDYKKEIENWWSEKNKEDYENEMRSLCYQ
jgi:hypothetical protein